MQREIIVDMMARWVLRHSFKRLLVLLQTSERLQGNTHGNKNRNDYERKREITMRNPNGPGSTIPVIINAKNINALIGQVLTVNTRQQMVGTIVGMMM